MKFKMAEQSLFAILLRSSWWTSAAVAVAVVLVARLVLPERYVLVGSMAALPFLGIAATVAIRQLRSPRASRVASVLEAIQAMSWREFAAVVEEAFTRQGYAVTRVERSAADFQLVRDGRTSLVSCKRWKAASTGVEPLRELSSAAGDADERLYLVIAGLTDNARRFAAERRLRLIEGVDLAQLLGGVARERRTGKP